MKSDNSYPLVPITYVLETIVDNRGKSVPTSDTGFPLIATNCIKHSSIYPTLEKLRYVSQETLKNWFRAELKPHDILFVNKGTPGRVCIVPDPVPFCAAQDMIGLRCNREIVYPWYLLAVLRSDQIQTLIANYHVGIAIPHFKKSDLPNLEIPLLPMAKQIQIGDAYFNLSEKIETNTRISSELESLAQDLYHYWFTQLDFPDEQGRPYRAAGGRMVWNEELGREIPEGWEAGSLFDIADFMNGLACQRFRPEEGKKKLPVIKIKEMHEGFSHESEFVRESVPRSIIIDDGDTLFSWSASLEVQIWTGGRGALNQHIFKVTSDLFPQHFIYFQLLVYLEHFRRIAENRKTTMGHITQDHLKQSRVIVPPGKIAKSFESIVEPLFRSIVMARQESRELASLRDFLLPLLMSGQVRVRS